MSDLASGLFQSETRTRLLRLLLVEKRHGSLSELARRCDVSPRALGKEVMNLMGLGLIHAEALGASTVISPNLAHPACGALRELLALPSGSRPEPSGEVLRASLKAYGAPLVGVPAQVQLPLNETLLQALAAARRDSLVLRVLPVVLAKHRSNIDWTDLLEEAKKRRLKAELGMLLELTGSLIADPTLLQRAATLRDRRMTRKRYLPEVGSRFEKALAEQASPPAALKWGFFVNMDEESFRSFLRKHLPEQRLA